MIKKLFSNIRFLSLSLIMFVFYLWLANNIPYTHDDWDWGLQEGLYHLFTADINNRFSGNLIEVILTRNTVLKTAFMGIVFTMIPFVSTAFVSKITCVNEKKNADFIHVLTFGFANAMILLMPVEVWQQTYGWVAGFSNFVVSGLGLTTFFYLIISLSPASHKKTNFIIEIAVFVFGFAIQLFLENLTLYFFIFSIVLLIIFRKNRNAYKVIIPLSAGIFTGLIVMYLNKIYPSIFITGSEIEDYRQLMYDPSQPISVFIHNSIYRFFIEFIPQIFFYNGILMGLIAMFMAFLAIKRLKKHRHLLCLANFLFGFYYLFTGIIGKLLVPVAFIQNIILDCIFIILIIVDSIIIFGNSKNTKFWLITLFISPLIIILPMLLINTVGPRCYFTTLLCHVIFAMVLLETSVSETNHKTAIVFASVTGVTLLVVVAHLIYIYIPIGKEMKKRNQMIETAISENWDTIVFSEYPNSEYIWRPDPGTEDRVRWFREFYHIPKDVKLFFESWKRYMKNDNST